MKSKSNKKVVDAVRNFITGAAVGVKKLEKKGATFVKKAESAWDSTKPRRDTISAKVSDFAKSARQVKDDIAKGVRQGVKEAKKK